MPFNGWTFNKISLGGSESAAYYMSRGLAKNDHDVVLFTSCREEVEVDGVRYLWMGEISEQYPAGERFMRYATKTPHDVLIIQRQPHFFGFCQYASKINLLWTHDLAMYQHNKLFNFGLPNIDAILPVSEWHADQMHRVTGIDRSLFKVLRNGVDTDLYAEPIGDEALSEWPEELLGKKILTYTHRPERGLEFLLKPGGIMERLLNRDDVTLIVAGYDNTTSQMRDYYEYLWQRCDALPNVFNVGPLNKCDLRQLQQRAYLHIYPTEFEETSCITMMECAAAGTPILTTNAGALPETLKFIEKGAVIVPLNQDGSLNVDNYLDALNGLLDDDKRVAEMGMHQLNNVKTAYDWSHSVSSLEETIKNIIAPLQTQGSMCRHFIANSDIYALKKYLRRMPSVHLNNELVNATLNELKQCYGFMDEEDWSEHYTKYYEYEKQRGVDYGPEQLEGNLRFESVASWVNDFDDGNVIIDYGCAHGHYTANLAKRYEKINFIGIDITKSNVEKARQWAIEENIKNVEFLHGQVYNGKIYLFEAEQESGEVQLQETPLDLKVDGIIAAEVIEHVEDPEYLIGSLCEHLNVGGRFLATTPYGPWESIGYREHWPWRAHVHHFERQDIKDIAGHLHKFKLIVVSAGPQLGSYVWSFEKDQEFIDIGVINYDRKIANTVPKQTVTLCMITNEDTAKVLEAVESAIPIINQIVIGTDGLPFKKLQSILKEKYPDIPTTVFDLEESPVKSGFDVARNKTIAKADGDWILWLDSDETLNIDSDGAAMLRNNQFNGISIPQHNFSVHPPGILATDYPCRLFRNRKGIRFYGKVHEHPEIEMNEGIPPTLVQHKIAIAHMSYRNEGNRFARFQRNLKLMAIDRKENPNRILGKFLWLRDLAQMNARESQATEGRISPAMMKRYEEGCKAWNELLETEHRRIQRDALEFYSMLLTTVAEGFVATVALGYDVIGDQPPNVNPMTGRFVNKADLEKFVQSQLKEIPDVEKRYR